MMWRTRSCVPYRDSSRHFGGCKHFNRRRHEWRRGTHECAMSLSFRRHWPKYNILLCLCSYRCRNADLAGRRWRAIHRAGPRFISACGARDCASRAGDQSPASTINRAPHLFSAKNQQLSLPERKTKWHCPRVRAPRRSLVSSIHAQERWVGGVDQVHLLFEVQGLRSGIAQHQDVVDGHGEPFQ